MIREQFENLARRLPFTLISVGVGAGALIVVANLVRIAQVMRQGEPASELAWPLLALTANILFVGYFGYLAVLKRELGRDGR